MKVGWLEIVGGLLLAIPFFLVIFGRVPFWLGLAWALSWQVFLILSVTLLDKAGWWPS